MELDRTNFKEHKILIDIAVILRIPVQSCHPFHFKAATDSG
jgi:hypothetical protein